ncbi:protein BIG GRAIN 1-like A [Salvia divinorum]|uniref:Protein BIG GRAIN 1-like A n=1 Tax=Salvia divinorum TaxID=28513 RepID=A0ABD1HLD5_SALDI
MYSREKKEIPKPKKSHRNTPSFSSSLLDEICRSIDDKPEPQTASLSRVEKWIENDRTLFRRRPRCDNTVFPDTDPSIFTSTSAANLPRPVRTGREQDRYLFDEYEEQERNIASAENLIKSKSKAMRIYANLKKPISPGARLTTFLSSIFNRKKSKGGDRSHPAAPPLESPAKTRCSTKTPSKFAGRVEINNERSDLIRAAVNYRDTVPRANDRRPPLPPNAFQNGGRRRYTFDKSRYQRDEEEEESDGDAISESSSDLFELDHSSLFGIRDRFCEELPVYETTYFDQNRRLFR